MSTEKLLEYIKQDNDRRFDEIQVQLSGLENKVDLLFQFKWQIIGGAVIGSGLLSLLVTIALKFI